MGQYVDHGYRLLFYRGEGWLSWLIRWKTWGAFSHVALLTPDGFVIEAWHVGGVRKRKSVRENAVAYDVMGMSLKDWQAVEAWMEGQLGTAYDFRGILGFILRWERRNDRWFCSELVMAAFKRALGRNLLNEEPERVSPGDLARASDLYRRSRAYVGRRIR